MLRIHILSKTNRNKFNIIRKFQKAQHFTKYQCLENNTLLGIYNYKNRSARDEIGNINVQLIVIPSQSSTYEFILNQYVGDKIL